MRSLARALFGRGRSARTMLASIGTAEALSALSRRAPQVEPVESLFRFYQERATIRPRPGAIDRVVGRCPSDEDCRAVKWAYT